MVELVIILFIMYDLLDFIVSLGGMFCSMPKVFATAFMSGVAKLFLIPNAHAADHAVMKRLMGRLAHWSDVSVSLHGATKEQLRNAQQEIDAMKLEVKMMRDWRFRWLYYDWLYCYFQIGLNEAVTELRFGLSRKSFDAYKRARAKESHRNEVYDSLHKIP